MPVRVTRSSKKSAETAENGEVETEQSCQNENAVTNLISPAKPARKPKKSVEQKKTTPELDPNSIQFKINKELEDEESKLHDRNSAEEKKETDQFIADLVSEQEEMKEERYRKLQLLLSKSELYSRYLLERIEKQSAQTSQTDKTEDCEDKENNKRKTDSTPTKQTRKKRKTALNGESKSDEDLNSSNLSTASMISRANLSLSQGKPLLFTGELRPYQKKGLVWLNTMFENGVNGILADEMGLGKTIQCIAALAHLVTMGVEGPYLIVVPLSTLPNWINEFKRFAPKIPTVLYHGTRNEREVLRRRLRKMHTIDGIWNTYPVVCTSYEVAMADAQFITNLSWKYLIVDEGHRIKNAQCRLIRALSLYDSTYRLLLTGTPLQNNLSELWSLLNFLLPEVFDDLASFEFWFKLDCLKKDQQDQLIAEEKKRNVLAMLHRIMTPFILRRLKSDVTLDLPPKKEVIVYAPLTELQRDYYKAVVDRTILNLVDKEQDTQREMERTPSPVEDETQSDGRRRSRRCSSRIDYSRMLSSKEQAESDEDSTDEDIEDWVKHIIKQKEDKELSSKAKVKKSLSGVSRNITLRNLMMLLRKVCSHPYLLQQPIDDTGHAIIDEEVINKSGKMMLLDIMLKNLKQRGHKVLIFSQMTKTLDLIEDCMYLRKYQYCRLDGSTHLDDRRQQMEDFNTDPDMFVFLLSTRAGGLGINLSSADTVIIYDSDWNPQCDLQAQDRAHRIGQTKPVVVYRLVVRNTIDERMVERASRKRTLEKMIMHKERFKTGITAESEAINKPITPDELLDLLKSKDHESEVNSEKLNVISKRLLDNILDRSDLYREWDQRKTQQAILED